jgi:O-antigen/teichoic acid export membrane protein
MNHVSDGSEPISLTERNPATAQNAKLEFSGGEPSNFSPGKAQPSWWPPVSLPVARALMWCMQGGASILQQGFFAGAQFMANILLARWLSPASYGVFALAYSIFLLLLAFYIAMIHDPILIFGPGRYSEKFPQYIWTLVRAHLIGVPPLCLLVAAVARLLERSQDHELGLTLWLLSVAAPLLLLIWLCRAALYAQLKVWPGTAAGAGYFALLISSIWLLRKYGRLSPASALLAMGGVSLLVSVAVLKGFHASTRERHPPSDPQLRSVISDHWAYGRWAALTAVAAWVPVNLYYSLLPSRFGLESAAALRALMNLMYPLLHALMSLVAILVPILVGKRWQWGLESVRSTIRKLIAVFVPAAVLYLGFLLVFRGAVFHLLYHGRYPSPSFAVTLFVGSLPITTGVAYLLAAGLRSLERPQLIFHAYLASCVTALLIGIPLARQYGLGGAAAAMLLSDLPTIAVLSIYFLRETAAERTEGAIQILPAEEEEALP